MKKYLIILILFVLAGSVRSQLVSHIIHGDTLFYFNPSTRDSMPVNKSVINSPTIGATATSGSSHIKTVGSTPTVAQTGLGTGGSVGVALETGSTDAAGIITLTTGTTSVGSTGTVTLTFNGAYSGNQPVIILTLVKGATDWGALATVRQTTQSLTAPIFTWNNSATGAAVALTTGTTYKIAYLVIQK